MMHVKKICVIGLGLMGGSLALALRHRGAAIVGVEQDAQTRELACSKDVVDWATADLADGVETADLIILATPVKTILALLAELPRVRPDGCMVLDLGSTKAAVCAAMADLPDSFEAIGGHPMCGKEVGGLRAADARLYREQTFVLSRNGRTTTRMEQVACGMIDLLGGRPLFLTAEAHDEIVALVSHVPHLTAAALVQSAAALQDERAWSVSASGFRDAARLAGSDPRMVLDILLTNRTAVLAQLEAYQLALQAVANLLQAGDEQGLAAWLEETQCHYGAYRAHKAT